MKKYGLLLPKKQYQPSDDFFGAISRSVGEQVICPLGDWTPYLPVFEKQYNNYFDSMSCVTFSALNCLEILTKAKYGLDVNYSDRFIAKMSGTTEGGNYVATVADTIRKYGLVMESDYSFTPTMGREEFFSEVPEVIVNKGKTFLDKYNITYEFVNYSDLTDALRFAPIQVGVYAWTRAENGIYPDKPNARRNHLVTLVGYSYGEYWLIYDHYEPRLKKLYWNYKFGATLKYQIKAKNIMPKIKNNTLVQLVESSGEFGLYLDGVIFIDEYVKILMSWLMRNSGKTDGMVMTMTIADWEKFPKFNLKREPLYVAGN